MKQELQDALDCGAEVERMGTMIEQKIIAEFHHDFLEKVSEKNLNEFNKEVKNYYQIPDNKNLDGIYLLPFENLLLVLIYKDGKILPSKCQASVIEVKITSTLSIEDTDIILIKTPNGDEVILNDYSDEEFEEEKVTTQ